MRKQLNVVLFLPVRKQMDHFSLPKDLKEAADIEEKKNHSTSNNKGTSHIFYTVIGNMAAQRKPGIHTLILMCFTVANVL